MAVLYERKCLGVFFFYNEHASYVDVIDLNDNSNRPVILSLNITASLSD